MAAGTEQVRSIKKKIEIYNGFDLVIVLVRVLQRNRTKGYTAYRYKEEIYYVN